MFKDKSKASKIEDIIVLVLMAALLYAFLTTGTSESTMVDEGAGTASLFYSNASAENAVGEIAKWITEHPESASKIETIKLETDRMTISYSTSEVTGHGRQKMPISTEGPGISAPIPLGRGNMVPPAELKILPIANDGTDVRLGKMGH